MIALRYATSRLFLLAMVDRIERSARSALMSRIRGENTLPELIVRRGLHALGYRYRIHVRVLPGKPDVVFPSRRKVIFVHGCFWHGHESCRSGRVRPQANAAFWGPKLDRNKERDARHLARLAEAGWSVLVVWGCALRDEGALRERVVAFLGERSA